MLPTLVLVLVLALTTSDVAPGQGRPTILWSIHGPAEIFMGRPPGDPAQRLAGQWEAQGAVLDVAGGRVIWAEQIFAAGVARILSAELDGTDVRILRDGLGFVSDLELDGGTLYWADRDLGSVHRMGVDGSGHEELLAGLDDPTWIALDPGADRLYIVTVSPSQLLAAALDGSDLTELVGSLPEYTGDVEVDTTNDKLYFGAHVNTLGIVRRDLDGENPQSILLENALAIEVRGSHVYYSTFDRALARVSLGGGAPQVLTPNGEMRGYVFGLDLANDAVYQGDQVSGQHLARFRIDAMDTGRRILVERFFGDPHDVAVDASTGDVFFTSSEDRALLRVGIGGGEPIVLLENEPTLEDARGLAYEPGADRVLWARFLGSLDGGGIYAATTDGGAPMPVVPGLEFPHDLALDLVHGHVYWTEGAGPGAGATATIRRADLDGSDVVDILLNESEAIRGIDVDPSGGKVYWTDHDCECIHRASLDGSQRETILDGLDGVFQPHDVAVDPVDGVLYWTEDVGNFGGMLARIRRSDLDGSNPTNVYTGLRDEVRDLAFARVVDLVFADDFESGDLSAWSPP